MPDRSEAANRLHDARPRDGDTVFGHLVGKLDALVVGVREMRALRPISWLEHFPEKACPGRDPGWAPVFRRKCDKMKKLERFPIQLNRKAL
jgi:hypothetical protein